MVSFFDKSKNLDQKKKIAELSVAIVEDGMTIGLGSGSTMAYFVEAIAKRMKNEKLTVRFVPASKFIEKKAIEYQLNMISIDEIEELDIAFDGADWIIGKEILIKGGGGSLFREKKILLNAKNICILADQRKYIDSLSECIIPIEIIPFGYTKTLQSIEKIGGTCFIRKNKDEGNFVTDNFNYILDTKFSGIYNWKTIHEELKSIQGVVDTGVFYGMEFNFIS